MKKINILKSQFHNIETHVVMNKMKAETCEFKLAQLKSLAKENIYKAFELGRWFEHDNPFKMDDMTEELKQLERLTDAIDIIAV